MYDEVVSAYEQNIKFVVGFAGSGKSTDLSNSVDKQTVVLTPTHRAAKVLKNKGMTNVFTIHSVLKLVPTINQDFRKGQKLQRLQQIGDCDLKHIKRIVIDEFSMINVKIMDLLLAILPAEAEVLVYGDPYQLPPVDGEEIDPFNYSEDIRELTTQHRSNAPEVVETFMRFVEYIKTGNSKISLKMNPKIKKGSIKDFNPDTDRILAYTNNRVLGLNAMAAGVLGLPEDISEGENILVNDMPFEYRGDLYGVLPASTIYPTCISKGSLMEGEALQTAIIKTENDIRKFNTYIPYPKTVVMGDNDYYEVYYDLDHYNTSKKLKADVEYFQHLVVSEHNIPAEVNVSKWCKENYYAKYVQERGQAWNKYLTHQNYVFSIRRPFATTVHKAQGSEFSKVYIDQEDIKQSIKNNYYMTYARLMYVALSRAVDEVILII